jgi:hypothetical protein
MGTFNIPSLPQISSTQGNRAQHIVMHILSCMRNWGVGANIILTHVLLWDETDDSLCQNPMSSQAEGALSEVLNVADRAQKRGCQSVVEAACCCLLAMVNGSWLVQTRAPQSTSM